MGEAGGGGGEDGEVFVDVGRVEGGGLPGVWGPVAGGTGGWVGIWCVIGHVWHGVVCKGRSVGESGVRAGELTLECVYE